MENQSDEEEPDDDDADGDDLNEEQENATMVATPLGQMHIKTAEAIYLDGGKTTVGTQQPKKRFHDLVCLMMLKRIHWLSYEHRTLLFYRPSEGLEQKAKS